MSSRSRRLAKFRAQIRIFVVSEHLSRASASLVFEGVSPSTLGEKAISYFLSEKYSFKGRLAITNCLILALHLYFTINYLTGASYVLTHLVSIFVVYHPLTPRQNYFAFFICS